MISVSDYVDTIFKQIDEQTGNIVLSAVTKVGVNVNKEELIRALKYDRNQYERGYEDGKRNGIVWNPYLDEKPKDLNDKLVTIRESNGNRYTSIGYFDENQWYGRSGFWIPNNFVTAWAELPKPYEEGTEG